MKIKHCLVPALLAASLPASADMIGAWVGVNGWSYDINGSVRYQSANAADDIDVNRDLGYNNDNLASYYVMIDHPLPLIPNVKISKTTIDTSANGTLSASFTFGGTTFSGSEAVNSSLKLDQTDITAYWRILDNIANLDIGLTAKYLDTKTRITGASSGTANANVSTWVPMAYAGVGVDLPFSGLAVSADGSYIGYSGSNFYDYTVRATYDTPWLLGVDVGYRRINLKLDDIDGSYANVTFKGPYAGLYLHF
ncbi:MAG: TIGR04219 family outer membrane beta-barrel protein [Gammaproteobacteria bacterium]|nr:TIGR04219 family outer membrane beta-barrel protein [Gammaproteobacteria bacterium]